MSETLREYAELAILKRVFPGCVIGIVRVNGERELLPFGRLIYDNSSPEVREDTIYDLASITKSIPVASLVAMFVANGRLNLQDKITNYIPELQNGYGATIEDLLRYRVRGARMSELAEKFETFEQVRTCVFERGFDGPPGNEAYANAPAFLLGIILERVGGEILPALAQKYFFGPLTMSDTTFFPHDHERIAPTEIIDGKEIRGIVHDESARMFAAKRHAVGHAGLFSTAPDLLNFVEALLIYNGEPFVWIADAAEKGLGWEVNQQWFMGRQVSKTAFGKTGFTGTSVIIDREKGIGLVILSNRTYPTRPSDAASVHAAINVFRAEVADIVFSS